MAFNVEVEMYPGDWMEIDPGELYDDQLVSLADHLGRGTLAIEQLNDTYWNLSDFTLPPRPIRLTRTG